MSASFSLLRQILQCEVPPNVSARQKTKMRLCVCVGGGGGKRGARNPILYLYYFLGNIYIFVDLVKRSALTLLSLI